MLFAWEKYCRYRIGIYIQVYFFKIVEAVIQQRSCVRKSTVCRIQHNCNENGISSLGIGDKRTSRCIGVSGLSSQNPIVCIRLSGHHLMVIEKITGFRLLISRRNLINLCGHKFTESGIIPGCLSNLHHITCGGIMRLIRKTIWIIKMGVLTAKLSCPLVHQFNKLLYRTACFFCQSKSHFIGGFQHQSHQGLLYCENLSCFCVNAGASGLNPISRFLRHGDRIVHIQMFTGQKSGHDLSDTGGI